MRSALRSTILRGVRRTPAALPLLFAAAAAAQVSPNGDQFQVNQFTDGAQRAPSATTDGRGIVVVTWEQGTQISGRRFAATGAPLGAEFQVNSLTTAVEYTTAVAADTAGRFVVVWDSFGSTGNDSSDWSIQARRFAADGTPAGAQFQVNTVTTDYQRDPDVAKAPGGAFVVVWSSDTPVGSDSEGTSIQGRLYDVNGTPVGAAFQVNDHTPNDQTRPAVAMTAGGGFVVAWESYSSPGSDGDFKSIQARRYSSSGTPQGSQFQVNTYTTGIQSKPDVSIDGTGRAVIAWASNEATGDGDLESIHAQRYASNGTAAGAQFQVNQSTTFAQTNPSLASDPSGRFVVAWDSESSTGNDTTYSVQARRYAAGGTALTAEFQVNTYTPSYQREPSVTTDPLGNFVVAWQSFGSNGTDGEGYGVHARRYDQLFRDGFGTGNTSRWSVVAP
jgi:hypothetical protein